MIFCISIQIVNDSWHKPFGNELYPTNENVADFMTTLWLALWHGGEDLSEVQIHFANSFYR